MRLNKTETEFLRKKLTFFVFIQLDIDFIINFSSLPNSEFHAARTDTE